MKIRQLTIYFVFFIQAQLKKELNEEKLKNETLSRLVLSNLKYKQGCLVPVSGSAGCTTLYIVRYELSLQMKKEGLNCERELSQTPKMITSKN